MKLPIFPAMRCDDGCGECCGPVPVDASELARVKAYAEKNGITPKAQSLVCPFYQGGKCAVYSVRPMLCQLFGRVRGLRCSRGYNTDSLSPQREHQLLGTLARGPKKEHTLHELLGRENG